MQYKIEISQDSQYALVKSEGIACSVDFINIVQDLMNHSDFELETPGIYDFREINTEKISTKDIRVISNFVKTNQEQFENSRWALIFNDDLGYGLARMWQATTEMDVNFQIHILKDEEKAFNWVMSPDSEEKAG